MASRAGDLSVNSPWWNPGERRERPVLPVGARRPADKAREGGIPGVFRPKRNDERRAATRFSRDGSPAERRVGFITGCLAMDRREQPPAERRAGFITGCLAGMDRRPSPHRENWAAWVSLPVVWPGWIAGRAPTGRTGPRGFHHRLFGRDGSPAEPPPGELGRVGFATGCLAGCLAARTPPGFPHGLLDPPKSGPRDQRHKGHPARFGAVSLRC